MTRTISSGRKTLRRWLLLAPLALLLQAAGKPLLAQTTSGLTPAQPSVIMLSDLHFDPLQDPDKVPRLERASVSAWRAILESPPSPNQAARFATLQQACSGKGAADASYALLRSSLDAAKSQAGDAAFVTVSGDLLVHDLDCRFRASMGMPASVADDQSASAAFAAFAEKTAVFVMEQVESTFPYAPVYLALGNNDSRCDHNRLDPHDAFLNATAPAILNGLHGVGAAEKTAALRTFQSGGYYTVTLPPPMRNTRLIVLNDIYAMPKYSNCSGDASDHTGVQEQQAWLERELQKAKDASQRVWVLGHLPPIVNADASLSAKGGFCPAGTATRYQASDTLANDLAAFPGTIKLAIFGHTHMDEFFLLPATGGGVPIKVVSSVSPVSGNLPSFTVGSVDPVSATLADYAVYQGSNTTGEATSWPREYSFQSTYRQPGFTPASLTAVIAALQADTAGTSDLARAYRQHMLKGSTGKKLSKSWPGYACSLNHPTAKDFTACVCTQP